MIELFGPPNTSEERALKIIIELFNETFSGLEKRTDIVIKSYAGAKFHGYKIKDIDCVLICKFDVPQSFNPTRGINTRPDDILEKKEIFIDSLVLCIEVKDHPPKGIKFEGPSVKVKYQRNRDVEWHDASEQNMKQAHTLRDYFNDEFSSSPWITHLIYLSSLEERDLPIRPHNIITPTIKARDLFTVISEQSVPYRGKNHRSTISCCPPEHQEKFINSRLFRELTPSSLDRKKVDAIARLEGFSEQWLKEVGKRMVIFRGSAGTGKTIALLQLANRLFETKGSRTLFLTYNRALVSDISRITMYLGLPSTVDDGGIGIQSSYSFFHGVLKSFQLLTEDENFLDVYGKLMNELHEILEKNIFSSSDLSNIFRQSPDTYGYDYVFIDEGQDWQKHEVQIIKKVFSATNIVVADGMDQLIRGARAEWTFGLKEAERVIFSFNESLRMKSNLTNFTNQLASNEGVPLWRIKQHNKIKGGSIAIVTGDFYTVLPKIKIFIEEAEANKNKPIDLLMLITHQLADDLQAVDSEKFISVEDGLNCKIYPAFKYTLRSKSTDSFNELRVLQYQSARGLEGWTTFLMNFDQFIENQTLEKNKEYDKISGPAVSREEWIATEINRWMLMVLTRSVDTTVLHFLNKSSAAYEKFSSYAEKNPDFISEV